MAATQCKVSQTKKAVRDAVAANEAEEVKKAALPITVLSGFLGAGKTTLLRHILTNAGGRKIACVVNDVAALNIDSALVKNVGEKSTNIKRQNEELVELQNGCVCCTLRADLVKSVADLARQGAFDHVLIECTGMAEPLQVASSFLLALAISEGERSTLTEEQLQSPFAVGLPSLDRLARLDTLVTVLDTGAFLDVLHQTGNVFAVNDGSGETLPPGAQQPAEPKKKEEGGSQSTDEPKLLVDLMIGQVEFANVVVLNKTDLVTEATLQTVRKSVEALNCGAKIVASTQSVVSLDLLLNTGLFDPTETAAGVGWLRALRETKEFGVGSFVYRRRRPFHPARFASLMKDNLYFDDDWNARAPVDHSDHDHSDPHVHERTFEQLEQEAAQRKKMEEEMAKANERKAKGLFKNVLRSKGFVWIATRPAIKGSWGHAGAVVRLDPEGIWNVVFSQVEEGSEEAKKIQQEIEENEHGDRKQEVVIIGVLSDVEKEAIAQALDSCLVSDEEWDDLAKLVVDDPIEMWQEDPFDDWDKYLPTKKKE